MTQSEIHAAMYETAGDWFAGLDLEIDEVSLGDAMKYDVLRVMGRLIDKQQKEGGDGRQPNDS